MSYIKSLGKRLIPKKYIVFSIDMYVTLRYLCNTVLYFGLRFGCPCCGGRLRKFVEIYKNQFRCPRCGSFERQRLLYLYLKNRTNFFTDNLKILHVGASPFLQREWKKLRNLDYISADLSFPTAMVKMDITDISLPDNQFDCIICYHVLEHIRDDQKAMKELFRVLKPGGWAILQSCQDPNLDKTIEDPNIISPEDRFRLFGWYDHLRRYGKDYKDKLENAGFVVKPDDYVGKLDDDLIKKYRLEKNELVYLCTKPKT